jgi:hypothetical protein
MLLITYQLQVLFRVELDDWARNHSKHALKNLLRKLAKPRHCVKILNQKPAVLTDTF